MSTRFAGDFLPKSRCKLGTKELQHHSMEREATAASTNVHRANMIGKSERIYGCKSAHPLASLA